MKIWPAKAPAAVEKFAFDFTEALNGATISTQAVVGDGATVSGAGIDGNFVRFLLSGGTEGSVVKVTCPITTSGGETFVELGVVPIGGEAVSLATAKAAQRIEGDDEDALLAGFLRAAIGTVERQTGKNLTVKIVSQTFDGFPGFCGGRPYGASIHPNRGALRLWQGPVSEILEVKYDDADGVEQTLANFRLVEGGTAGSAKLLPAFGESFPVTAIGPGTVRVTYVAGYDPAELPPELTTAAILLFGHWNANREAVVAGVSAQSAELPLGVQMLIDPYRSPGIA